MSIVTIEIRPKDQGLKARHSIAQGRAKRRPGLGLTEGSFEDLPGEFRILEFAPTESRKMWAYATCCMSQPGDSFKTEIHLFSPLQSFDHVELLTAISHYHRTGKEIGLGHSVNFGRPWIQGSRCEYGLISLPYLDGPSLEILKFNDAGETFVSFGSFLLRKLKLNIRNKMELKH